MAATKNPAAAGTVVGSWDEIEEQEFTGEYETLERGTYPFVLADAEKREGQDSGNEYVVLKLLHEKDDAEENAQKKFYLWENVHFTAKTIGNTKRILRILGVDLSVMAGQPFEDGVVPDELMDAIDEAVDGPPINIQVKRTRYKKKDSDDVAYRNEAARFLGD